MDKFFVEHRNNSDELHVTVLTTLQCNFACDYCLQGDHGEYNKSVTKMSPETARHVCEWFVERLDSVKPRKLVLTSFGGEPLLNLEALYAISERAYDETQKRGVESEINIITNGLLLTREIVDHLKPLGLNGVKVTLDGDRETHDRMRPLRGGQATFDRIVENIRQVADRCNIAIGGNFDEDSVDSYPALLDFLKEQSFADSLVKVAFKPIISTTPKPQTDGLIPLTAVDQSGKPLRGGCMTIAGSGGGSPCDSCHFLDEKMSFLREETKQRGFIAPSRSPPACRSISVTRTVRGSAGPTRTRMACSASICRRGPTSPATHRLNWTGSRTSSIRGHARHSAIGHRQIYSR